MPTFTTSSSLAALSSCSTCPVLDCREIDRRRNAVAGRTVLTTALVLHAECAGNRGGVCGSNVAEAGRRHAVRAAESDGPERRDRQDFQNRHRLHLRGAGGRGNLCSVPVSHPALPPSTSTSPRMTRNPVPPTRASAHMGWRGLACVWCMPSAECRSPRNHITCACKAQATVMRISWEASEPAQHTTVLGMPFAGSGRLFLRRASLS